MRLFIDTGYIFSPPTVSFPFSGGVQERHTRLRRCERENSLVIISSVTVCTGLYLPSDRRPRYEGLLVVPFAALPNLLHPPTLSFFGEFRERITSLFAEQARICVRDLFCRFFAEAGGFSKNKSSLHRKRWIV